jgi:hypothetical protein
MQVNSQNRFEVTFDKKKFGLLNKDRKISWLFRSSEVGKCAKIFDDYYNSEQNLTPKGWFLFYKSVMGIDILKQVSQKIMEITKLDEEICFEYTKFRILGQTWNGMLNEIDLINELKQEFPNIEFRKANYNLDENYFTDWEAYSKGNLFLGLQIKPISYMHMNTPYQNQAKLNHEVQRQKYKDEFKVPHFLIYYDNNKLQDKQKVTDKINTLLINLI